MDEVRLKRRMVIKADVLAMKHHLDAHQRALVIYLMEQPEADLQSLQAAFADVPCRTLQRDLQQAVGKRVLLASGATHQKRYRLNEQAL